jgi:hypothetical protein
VCTGALEYNIVNGTTNDIVHIHKIPPDMY